MLLQDNKLLFLCTAIVSFGLTFWAISVDPVVNPDALLYLSAADELKQGNIGNAFELYKWPFYSFVIAAVQTITGTTAQTSAYLFNGAMHAMAMLGFLACVHALGGNKKTLFIAALLILFFPSFNKYRSFIIRDAGFIAFYLWSLYHLFIAIKTEQICRYIFAFILIFIATLFRIEAIALLAIVPLYLFYANSSSKSASRFWLFLSILGSLVLFFGISIWIFGEQSKATQPGLLGLLQGSMEQLANSLDFKLSMIRQQLLNEFSYKFAPAVLIITVLCISVYEPLRRLSYIFAYFSWHALKERLVLQEQNLRHIFYVICLLQLALLMVFTLINMFLVSRHTVALVLTILLLAPFSLEYFWNKWQQRNTSNIGSSKWQLPLLALLLGATAIDGLDVKTNKPEIKAAGRWVAQQVADDTHVYSNLPLVLHYAGRRPANYNLQFNWREFDDLLVTYRIYNFDYTAISLTKNVDETREYISRQLNMKPTAEKLFGKKRTILIYDLRAIKDKPTFDNRYLKILTK